MAIAQDFVRLRFAGGRFEHGNGLHADVLEELTTYKRILTEIAKVVFHREHPGRVRVPAGFERRLDLRLVNVEPGSQIPVLERVPPAGELVVPPDEYDQARVLFAEIIEAAYSPEKISRDLMVVVPLFSKFGQSLRSSEWIGVPGSGQAEVRYDRSTRARLIEASGEPYRTEAELLGWVSDLNSQTGRFELRLTDGSSMPTGEFGDHWAEFHRAQGPTPEKGRRVRVTGYVEFSARGEARKFLAVDSVAVLDTWEWATDRVEELQALPDGWFGADSGAAITAEAATSMVSLIDQLQVEKRVKPPPIFPTENGGLQAEWVFPALTISVESDFDGSYFCHKIGRTLDSATSLEVGADHAADAARWLSAALEPAS